MLYFYHFTVPIQQIEPPYRPLLGILEEDLIDKDNNEYNNDEDDTDDENDNVKENLADHYDLLERESSDFKGFDGEYGPYFPNFTSAMLFIWITKHMICK